MFCRKDKTRDEWVAVLFQLAGLISGHDVLDPLVGVQQIADGGIMVQSVNDIGNVLAQVAIDIPFATQ